MALLDQRIEGLVVGDDWTITREVDDIPAGHVISKAYFLLKTDAKTVDDASATINLAITTTLTSAGQITNAGSSGTGSITFTPTNSDTANLNPGQSYDYGIKVILDNGAVAHTEIGTLVAKQGVVTATS